MNPFNLGLFFSGTYFPYVCDISAITQAEQAVVTTTIDHGFSIGNRVQFFIPPNYGMRELDKVSSLVVAIPSDNQITVELDTRELTAFSIPSGAKQTAQVAGVGDFNYGNLSPGGVAVDPIAIPGSFLNEYP